MNKIPNKVIRMRCIWTQITLSFFLFINWQAISIKLEKASVLENYQAAFGCINTTIIIIGFYVKIEVLSLKPDLRLHHLIITIGYNSN